MPTGTATTIIATFIYKNIWRNNQLKAPTDLKPEDNGWNFIDRNYVFNWFEGIRFLLLSTKYYYNSLDTAKNESSEAEEHIGDNAQFF